MDRLKKVDRFKKAKIRSIFSILGPLILGPLATIQLVFLGLSCLKDNDIARERPS